MSSINQNIGLQPIKRQPHARQASLTQNNSSVKKRGKERSSPTNGSILKGPKLRPRQGSSSTANLNTLMSKQNNSSTLNSIRHSRKGSLVAKKPKKAQKKEVIVEPVFSLKSSSYGEYMGGIDERLIESRIAENIRQTEKALLHFKH